VCGIVCILLVVLWWRSYYQFDQLIFPAVGNRLISLGSLKGTFDIGTLVVPSEAPEFAYLSLGASSVAIQDEGRTWTELNEFRGRSWIFQYAQPPNQESWVRMPSWFPILLLATTAILPWIRWRFSLRTLLIATTLIAILLGLIVYAAS
jgi:hypothetical protein